MGLLQNKGFDRFTPFRIVREFRVAGGHGSAGASGVLEELELRPPSADGQSTNLDCMGQQPVSFFSVVKGDCQGPSERSVGMIGVQRGAFWPSRAGPGQTTAY